MLVGGSRQRGCGAIGVAACANNGAALGRVGCSGDLVRHRRLREVGHVCASLGHDEAIGRADRHHRTIFRPVNKRITHI